MEHVRPLVKQLETDYYIDEDMIRDAIRRQSSFNLIHLDTILEVDIFIPKTRLFDQEELRRLFSCFGVTLTVLEPGKGKTPEQELTDDLLALIASFSGRLYGMRSHKQKELVQCAQAVLTSP